MYTEIYESMVEAGIAVKHNEKVWRSANGDVVKTEAEAVGVQSEFEFIHPDLLLFVDEVGSNTSQTKDGQVGKNLCAMSMDGPSRRQQLRTADSPLWDLQQQQANQ
jgi:hypothetical protein